MLSRTCPNALRTAALRSPCLPSLKHPSVYTRLHHCPTISGRPLRQVQPPHYSRLYTRRKASTRAAATKLFKEYPFSVSLATVMILFGFGSLIYINYIYQIYIIGDFAAYPEPVAAKLRRALYYTNIDLQPKNAIKYYRQALMLADEIGMDPFSDEILGVKIQLSALFEKKLHNYQKAIDVLEIVRSDCLRWMEELGGLERNRAKRTRVLGKTIGISVRLGEFYANEHIDDQEAAEEKLVWAVTALLKEQRRREENGVKEEEEGKWMSNEEIGASLESLGNHYEANKKHYLAAPLFLQALGLCPPFNCHSVVLMNNLAISLALQNPPSTFSSSAPSSPTSHLSSAKQWALKALELAASIKPPARTAECDEGCAVATINLGDFARMEGDLGEARRRWEEGGALSRAVEFGEGARRAEGSLKELKGKQ